jgi:Na+-transporting methylmalonyl-CoA/oxaloacetate decarboxylase gamma subunit
MINFFKNIGLRIVSFFMMLLLLSILIGTINFIGSLFSNESSPKKEIKKEIKKEVEKLAKHYHYWNDNKSRQYRGNVSVKLNDVNSSKANKKNINPISWGYFYEKIVEHDKLKLSTIYDLFDQISRTKVLSRNEFADVIVTFVQNIPYNILTSESCSDAYLNSKSIKEMIDQGTDCDGNVFGGLYTPTEFIKNFKGDCDTRTVFLYTILNRYGYDTRILNSDFYRHSIIGVNLPSRGRFKTHLGKRYYTWETTNINWQLGDLPPSTSRMGFWFVAL